MFAVIKTGGKQYKVASGDVIAVEKLAGEPGSGVELEQVLMIGDGASMTVGKPFVAGAAVGATVVEQTRGEKIIIFKKKRRQNYRRRNGHRQDLTVLKITDIYPAGTTRKPKVVVEAKPVAKEAKEAAHPAKKAAHKPAAKKEAAHKERAKKPAAKAKKESSAKGKAGKSKEK